MIFPKKLENAIITVKNKLPESDPFSDTTQIQQSKLDALMEIVNFVKQMNYIKRPRVKEKFSFFLRSKYDYQETATHFGTSRNSIDVMVSRVSRQLESLVGKETIDMILQEKVSEALRVFRSGILNESAKGFFLPEAAKYLPEPKYRMFNSLEECSSEIRFLNVLTEHGMKNMIEGCDQEKLAHILYLISDNSKKMIEGVSDDKVLQSYFENGHHSREKVAIEREALLKLFNGEFSMTDIGEHISNKYQVEKALDEVRRQHIFHDAGSGLELASKEG